MYIQQTPILETDITVKISSRATINRSEKSALMKLSHIAPETVILFIILNENLTTFIMKLISVKQKDVKI